MNRLRSEGASVMTATSDTEARAQLAGFGADIIISDATRRGDRDAGFEEAQALIEDNLYDGPILFYVSRITASRRERAARLGAKITNNAGQLLRELNSLAAQKRLREPATA